MGEEFQNSSFAERGRKIEHFGRLMQLPSVTVDELARAAFDAGLSLGFVVTAVDGEEVRDSESERERAAQICDEEAREWDSDNVVTHKNYAEACADRIRGDDQ